MRAWSSPHLPSLPGRGPQVHLYDTSAGAIRATTPGPTASLYVCGITPYDATHLGHAATYVAFDTLNRAWRDAGHDVRYVQNITDVDDPLLERAAKTGQDWRELAHEQTQLFREDMQWLRVLAPQHYMGAVETIPLVVELIGQLEEASAVYELDGDLYFSVRSDADFGAVAGLDDDTMRSLFAERGGDPERPGKKDPLDCLLWQAARAGEPSWRSRFGPGRPGWHIECTAIALRYLGDPFDVQGGGRDLAFPHHEMSASESHVATGRRPFARAYVHAGMVGLHGQKMSKSLGNLVFASRLRADGSDPAAVRLALLSDHYRSDRDWTENHLAAAEERLARWRAATSAATGPAAEAVLAAVRRSLADDLDTPAAIAAIDAWAEQALAVAAAPTAPSAPAAPSAPTAPSAPGLVRAIADTLLGISL